MQQHIRLPTVTRASSPLDAQIPEASSNDVAAVLFLEEQRGRKTDADATRPKCGVIGESRRMKAKDGSGDTRSLWRCGACKSQFTVKVGTTIEDSPIPARYWCLAFYRAAASKKGISALQLQGETGLFNRSALFLMHRIRWAMAPANERASNLGGNGWSVEFDETYIGGQPRYSARKGANARNWGNGKDFDVRKTAVVGGVEQDGRVQAVVVSPTTAADMAVIVRRIVDTNANLRTDESSTRLSGRSSPRTSA